MKARRLVACVLSYLIPRACVRLVIMGPCSREFPLDSDVTSDLRIMIKESDLYKAQEFAERAGVTVRTLHHYDRLGLLSPSGRTEAGYRLYGDRDLVRLEQILALKFIGFPLQEIRRLLKRDAKDLPSALRRQRTLILEKRRLLDLAAQAIQRAETAAASGELADWEAIKK